MEGNASGEEVNTRRHDAVGELHAVVQTSSANCRRAVNRDPESGSGVTDGVESSTFAAITPPQLVASVPSMRKTGFREPAVDAG